MTTINVRAHASVPERRLPSSARPRGAALGASRDRRPWTPRLNSAPTSVTP